jgi:hypothetical protein
MHRSKKALFDHFVGGSEQQARQLQAELPCSFLVRRRTRRPAATGSEDLTVFSPVACAQ